VSKQAASSTCGNFASVKSARKSNSPLVLDGETVKLRLEAERTESGNSVHVDWVRFTTRLKNAPIPSAEMVFPKWDNIHDDRRVQMLKLSIRDLGDSDFPAAAQAHQLAVLTSAAMGSAFSVDSDIRKGMDFYKCRWSIMLNGAECGWVGFLSSSDSPRQQSQAATIHVNLFGTACTFADAGWNLRLADLVDNCEAELTRADLALDFFDGYEGGIESVVSDYVSGLCNVGGRKLKFNQVGDWANGHDRSVYVGSREAGKVTNVYEKGDQLYGEKTGSDWLRFELRYGNKLRVLSSEILRRPDDFFSGASDWHQSVMLRAKAVSSAESVPCVARLPIESIKAECTRNLRWLVTTAASSIAVAVQCLDTETLFDLVGAAKLPGRLAKFSMAQIQQCFGGAVEKLTPAFPSLVLDKGTEATYSLVSSVGSPPAFA
jgi:phage replication initiation protein